MSHRMPLRFMKPFNGDPQVLVAKCDTVIRSQCIVLCAVLLAFVPGCSEKKAEVAVDSGPKVIPVTVKPLVVRAIERKIDVVGSLKGWEEFQLGAKKGGRVLKVHHDIGDRVKPGEVLVDLDPVDARLALVQAERALQAELARLGLTALPDKLEQFDVDNVPAVIQAKVAMERAAQNLARQRALSQRGAGSAQELQDAENDYRGGEAGLNSARVLASAIFAGAQVSVATIDVAKQILHEMTIRVPEPQSMPPDGTEFQYAITKRNVSEGQFIRDGETVAELVIENPLKYIAKVPERYTSQMQVGQELTLQVASFDNRTFKGKVTRVNPSVDPITRTFQVEATIPNSQNELRPGGFAKADIMVDRKSSGVVVPIEAVIRTVGVTKIFLVVDDEKSPTKKAVREIQVSTDTEGVDWIEIVGDLPRAGEVVTSGQSQLADNTPIRIKTAEETDGSDAKPTSIEAVSPITQKPQAEVKSDVDQNDKNSDKPVNKS
jgi:RND family efflux transporter MFP subunit